jgi:hypothetical protein
MTLNSFRWRGTSKAHDQDPRSTAAIPMHTHEDELKDREKETEKLGSNAKLGKRIIVKDDTWQKRGAGKKKSKTGGVDDTRKDIHGT